jgi:hypothetical protein
MHGKYPKIAVPVVTVTSANGTAQWYFLRNLVRIVLRTWFLKRYIMGVGVLEIRKSSGTCGALKTRRSCIGCGR